MIKISQEKTNYFHLSLIIIAGLGVAALIYISYILTIVVIDETVINPLVLTNRKVALSLTSDKNEYHIGDIAKISVLIDTLGRKTPGVDIILAYNPEFLEISGKIKSKIKGKEKVKPEDYLDISSSRFDTFPYMSIDLDKSLISFSALMLPLQDFQGSGEIASLNFKTLKSGATQVKFIFERKSTTDSNVAFAGKDILTSVKDLEINIK